MKLLKDNITMASLFDGIGGFPLAAVRCGVEPVWASEIEPFPILVTKLRFPQMTHMGDMRVCPKFCVNAAGQCKIEPK